MQQINVLPDDMVRYAMYCHPSLPLVYINNPKAACSSAKASLASYKECIKQPSNRLYGRNIHLKTGFPFVENFNTLDKIQKSEILLKPFFSIVRNPYSRIFSSYYHKILGKDPSVREWFCKRFMIMPHRISQDTLPFEEFLQIIAFDDPIMLNPHFRTQSINLMYPLIRYDFIGNVEVMDETSEYLLKYGVNFTTRNKTSSNNTDYMNCFATCFNEFTKNLVQSIFKEDFQNFGYSMNTPPNTAPIEKKERKATNSIPIGIGQLSDALEFLNKFEAEPNIGKKLDLALNKIHSHKNRRVLRIIHTFLNENGEFKKAQEIKDHIHYCLTGHLKFLSNKDIISTV